MKTRIGHRNSWANVDNMDRVTIAYLQNYQRWNFSPRNGRKQCTSYMGVNDCKPRKTSVHTASSWWAATSEVDSKSFSETYWRSINRNCAVTPSDAPSRTCTQTTRRNWFSKPEHHHGPIPAADGTGLSWAQTSPRFARSPRTLGSQNPI